MPTHTPDCIPAAVAEFLDFYRDVLADFRFADLDQASLEALVAQVREGAAEVGRARAQLEAAQEALEASQVTLRQAAERGIAYAKVYAQDQPELTTRLDALALAQGAAVGQPTRVRRRRGAGRGEKKTPSRSRPENEASAPVLPFSEVRREEEARAQVA